jgi:hypothetical protein
MGKTGGAAAVGVHGVDLIVSDEGDPAGQRQGSDGGSANSIGISKVSRRRTG